MSRRSDFSPRAPIYIPSKGRAEYMFTSKALTKMGVAHFVVVEPNEVPAYQAAVARLSLRATVIPLDMSYKARYEVCDGYGLSKPAGSGPARNFIWDHAAAAGAAWHWTVDDNIKQFYRLNHNLKVPTTAPAFWRAMEDFADRYANVAMAGPNYFMFASRKAKMPPFVVNTRIYSCNLIRTSLLFRWRGRYNEDTILSLDMLKAGWATLLFNAFLQEKMTTQTLPGGNTDELYRQGTLAKSKMLAAVHPQYARVVERWGRDHHYVDYTPFKDRALVRRSDVVIPEEPNEYGMRLAAVPRRTPPRKRP